LAITVGEIRDDLIDPHQRLADILRKAKVLAYRLDIPEFKQWVDHELDGYAGTNVELPDYRNFPAHNYGTFSGFGGSLIDNQPIPIFTLPDWAHQYVEKIELRQGVAAMEDLGPGARENPIKLPWPPELIALMGEPGRIVSGYALSSAWQLLTKNQIDGILDTVRNRLLTFMLELEDQFPDLAESEVVAGHVPKEQAANIFHTNIYGSQNVVATGTHFTQIAQPSIPSRDLAALLNYLRELGISEEDVMELQEIVEEGEIPSEPGRLGPRAESWLGRLTTKGIEGATTATVGQVVQYAAKAIAQYFGFDSGS
jgi:hypothetical protein